MYPPPVSASPISDVEMLSEGEEAESTSITSSPYASITPSPQDLESRENRVAFFKPIFKELCSQLRRMKSCVNVVSIPGARCPIIHFVHHDTMLHCDVSVTNV